MKTIITLLTIALLPVTYAKDAELTQEQVLAHRQILESRMEAAIKDQRLEIESINGIIEQLERSKADLQNDVFVRSKTRAIDAHIERGKNILVDATHRLSAMLDYQKRHEAETKIMQARMNAKD